MKAIIFLVLLLQNLCAQHDSLRQAFLDQSASAADYPTKDIIQYFGRFFNADGEIASPAVPDTNEISYFEVVFTQKPEYNLYAKLINADFNYQLADKNCNNSNRNGILVLEKIKRTPPVKDTPEKLDKTVYVFVPDVCSTTRFYNAKGEMFCNNRRQFKMEYEEWKKNGGNLRIKIGIQLLPESRGDFYAKQFPAEKNYPVETHLKEYVIRCCVRSILFLNDDKIIDNFVSLKP